MPRAQAAKGDCVRRWHAVIAGTREGSSCRHRDEPRDRGRAPVGRDPDLRLAALLAAVRRRRLPLLARAVRGRDSFWIVLRDLAPARGSATSLWVWERSFAARYMPSGAMTVAVRMVERERLGASRAQMLSATAYEQLVAAAAAAA